MEISFIRKYWKAIIFVVLVVGSFLGGWKANEVYHGYKDNLEARIEKLVEKGIGDMQQAGAKNLLDSQQLLKDRKVQIIEKELPIIVEKKVYSNPSLDQDGVDYLNKLKEVTKEERKNREKK